MTDPDLPVPDKTVETSDRERLVTEPAVSVLMLAYAHERYLSKAIESVMSQECDFPFELLIGEDCSPDGTLAVALAYQSRFPERIRVITSEHNVGMQANFRRLVAAARGPYLANCEGDDYWTSPSVLAQQLGALVNDTNAVAVHADFTRIVQVGSRWRGRPRYWRSRGMVIPEGRVLERLLTGNFIQTCTLMIRKKSVVGYLLSDLPTLTYAVGDWPMCLFASAEGDFVYLDASLAAYREVPGSATNLGAAAEIRRAEDSMRMASDFVRHFALPVTLEVEAHRQAMRHILATAMRSGDRTEARRALAWLDQNTEHGLSSFESLICRFFTRSATLMHFFAFATRLGRVLLTRASYRSPAP